MTVRSKSMGIKIAKANILLTVGGGGASRLIYICGIASTLSTFLTKIKRKKNPPKSIN